MTTDSHAACSIAGGQHRARDERRRLDPQHRRAQLDPIAARRQLGRRPAALGTDRQRDIAPGQADVRRARRRRSRAARRRPAAARRSRAARPRATAPSASTATRRSLARWRSARSASQRTTERSACSSTMRSTPISVSFWTIHSGRSAFGIANATVRRRRSRRASRARRHRRARTSPPVARHSRQPSATVGDRDDVAVAHA